MFIEVVEGRALDAAATRDEWLEVQAVLESVAVGWLGVTAGASADRHFVALLGFETEEAARITMDSGRERGSWDRLGRVVERLSFRECRNVRAFFTTDARNVESVDLTRGVVSDLVGIGAMFAPGTSSREGDPSVVGGLACWDAEGVAVTALYRTARAIPAAAESLGEPSLLLEAPTHLEIAPPWSILVAPTPSARAAAPISSTLLPSPFVTGTDAQRSAAGDAAPAVVGRWASIGPTLIPSGLGATGRVTTIAIDPSRPSTIYAGGLSGNPNGVGGSGVWKTTDGGSAWFPIADSLPSLKVAAIALAPGRPSRVYAALVDIANAGAGLYRSDDSGAAWTLIADDSRLNGRQLLIDASNPSLMFMAGAGGVYRSSDGGVSWSPVLAPPATTITDLAMDPLVPTRLYAGVSHATSDAPAGVYATRDSGATWVKQLGCPGGTLPANVAGRTIRLAVSGNRIYASFKTREAFVVYRTTDVACLVGGVPERTWQKGWTVGSDIAPTLWSFLYSHPENADIVYATGTNFWRSTNGGGSFSMVSGPHVDHHAFAVDPSDADVVYTGSDGGLYRSNSRGASGSWSFVGEGMTNTEFYDIGEARTDPDLVIGGTQDNGTIRRRPNGTVWDEIKGGDGATVDVDPTDATILYAMGQYASSIERRKGSGGFQSLAAGLPVGSTCFNLHYQVHPAIPTTLLASCGSLWRTLTNEPPGDWRMILPGPGSPQPAGNVVRSAVDGPADIYYAATDQGEVYAGRNGADWERVFSVSANCGGSASGITAVTVDPDEPATVYVASGRDGSCRVVRLRRVQPGSLAMSNEDITADLPTGIRPSALAVDRMNPGTIYAGTRNRAVYRGRLSAGSATWRWDRFSDGLPFAAGVVDLLAHPTTGVLRAGTLRARRVRGEHGSPARVGPGDRGDSDVPPRPRRRRLRPAQRPHRRRGRRAGR